MFPSPSTAAFVALVMTSVSFLSSVSPPPIAARASSGSAGRGSTGSAFGSTGSAPTAASTALASFCTLLRSQSFLHQSDSRTALRNDAVSESWSSVGSLTDVSNVAMRARIVRRSWTSSSA